MSELAHRFGVHVEQVDGFEFRVRFDKDQYAPLQMDEPAPLGRDAYPNAARILAAAIGNCLAASLVFCLKKQKAADPTPITADVDVEIIRTENRRLRIGKVDVTLHTSLREDDLALASCLGTFEDFCVVTQSVRRGIDVSVKVVPAPTS